MRPELVAEGGLDASVEDAGDLLREAGVVVLRSLLSTEAVETLATAVESDLNRVQRRLSTMLLDPETFAFIEACGRGKGRIDVKVDRKKIDVDLISKALAPVLEATFDGDYTVGPLGVVVSSPGSGIQRWHRDGDPLFPGHQLPAHAVTAFVPLVSVDDDLGPTQFLVGSHLRGDVTEPISPPFAGPSTDVGDVLLFDYRVIHRGVPNVSDRDRPVLYVVFHRSWFSDVQNFPVAMSLFSEDEPAVACLDENVAYSERLLARTPSGQLPERREHQIPQGKHQTVEFGKLRGLDAIRELERRCGFQYTATTMFLRTRDLRDRQLLVGPPAPRARELGIETDLDARNVAHVAVRPVPEVHGYGLFALDTIASGALVAEYAGLVGPSVEGSSFDGYALDYAQGLDGRCLRISARNYGNVARFINHDPRHPNAKLVTATPASGLRRILVVAIFPISPGDQILMDYGPAYWHGADVVPVQLNVRDDDQNDSPTIIAPPPSSKPRRPSHLLRSIDENTPLPDHPLTKGRQKTKKKRHGPPRWPRSNGSVGPP